METALKPYRDALAKSAGPFLLSSPPADGRPLGFYGYAPSSIGPASDLLVCVHGLNRNAASQLFRFRPLAEATGALLVAPAFSRREFRHYQTLQPARCGRRPDDELIRLMHELSNMFGLQDPAVRMFGYSGGGQFANRFAMRHPSRVRRLMLASPGWYTFPDSTRAFPLGVASFSLETTIDLDAFLQIPTDVVVGALDTVRDSSLNQAAEIDEAQGRTRLERATSFVAAVAREATRRGIAPQIALHVLENGVHSFEQNMDRCGMDALARRRLFPELARAPSAAAAPEDVCAR